MPRQTAHSDPFSAVADGTRRRLLGLLAAGERTVGDLVAAFPFRQPTISQHLRVLRDAGLVHVRGEGRRRFYSLNVRRIKEIVDWGLEFAPLWRVEADAAGTTRETLMPWQPETD